MHPSARIRAVLRLAQAMLLLPCSCQAVTAQSPPASATTDRDAVLAVVQAFFDTMAARDVAGARRILIPEGRLYAIRQQDGKSIIRARTHQEYLAELERSKKSLRERMWNPEVRIQGLLATVWTPYDFWVDGKLSHCGADAFQLIKTDEGWKIAGGAYTIESKGEPSPLGPLKQ